LAATRRAIELSSLDRPDVDRLSDQERAALAMQLERCQRDVDLDRRLASILDGTTTPADAQDSLDLAEICVAKDLNEPAARLYLQAFDADPALPTELEAGRRYRAACAAALARFDTGGGNARDPERPRWRLQSREWLRADLEQYAKRLENADPADAVRTYFVLSHWLTDPALASIRDEAPLTQLLREEAGQCHHLWAEVRAVRERAERKVGPGTGPSVGTAP
jgi:hypothetical protein